MFLVDIKRDKTDLNLPLWGHIDNKIFEFTSQYMLGTLGSNWSQMAEESSIWFSRAWHVATSEVPH